MKRNLLTLFGFFLCLGLQAQISDGSVFTQTITGTDVVTEEEIDLFAWLDDDKVVIVDVYATWCGPCWTFHQSGTLETLYEQYGPEGTDQIRIVGAEVDTETGLSEIMGTGNTAGNWLEGVHYNMIDNASWGSYFSASYYPSIFVVRPNRGVFHMYGEEYRANIQNLDWWDRALGFSDNADDMLAKIKIPEGSSCSPEVLSEIEIFNFGRTTINEASFATMLNGVDQDPLNYSGELEPFRKETYTLDPATIDNGTSQLSISTNTINGNAIPVDQVITEQKDVFYDEIQETQFLLKVHTDYYPAETSGYITVNGQNIKSFGDYEAGPEANGGGGDDAYKTHVYGVTLPFPQEEIECLNITVFDGLANGMTSWDGVSNVKPGIEIADTEGNTIKPAFEPLEEWNINRIEIAVNSISSNVNDVLDGIKTQVFPNPAFETIHFALESETPTQIKAQLLNSAGQILLENNIGEISGVVNESLDVKDFENGLYLLQLVTAKGTLTQKVIITK